MKNVYHTESIAGERRGNTRYAINLELRWNVGAAVKRQHFGRRRCRRSRQGDAGGGTPSEGAWGNAPSWRGRGRYSIRVSKISSPYFWELYVGAAAAFTL